MKSVIRNFISKMIAGRSDDGIMITLSDPRKVDFQSAMLEDLLMRNGIDPRAITNETQLKNIINQIKAAEAQAATKPLGIKTIEPGKVFDMEGKQIPRGSDIMGGKAVPGTSDRERVRNEMKKKYGFTDERLDEIENTPVDEKMADDLLREDDERIIKERLEKQNKDSVQRFKDKMDDPEEKANGGRIGYSVGAGKKGVQGLLDLVRNKFGKKSITTADKAPIPPKTLERDMFKKAEERFKNKQMTDEEVREFADEFGLDPSEEYYNWDGTLADARRLLKKSEDETKYMYQQYKAGRLDPKSGEKGREKFLEKKLEEAELSGESKLITRDEIEELEELKRVREMAPQMVERLELRARYPGITDDLLDSILIDDNPQRKAELLATLDEVFAMMRKGKGPDEVLRIIKDMNRTKQADGGITRANFLGGGMGRRGFLKMLAGLGAGVGAAKTGILKFAGKEPAKQVTKEVVKSAGSGTPPPYFFKLVDKIKTMGDDVTEKAATKEREVVTEYKEYRLTEDVATGEKTIQRVKLDSDFDYYDENLAEETYMNYKPGKGQSDEATGRVADEYVEDTSYIRTSGPSKGDIYDTVDGVPDEVIQEGTMFEDNMTEFGKTKKASGGIARMLGE